MRGVASAAAAITFVNAAATGIGCAAGIRLAATATVEVATSGATQRRSPSDDSQSPVVERALADAARRWASPDERIGHLSLRSDIPVGKGLKSSSAVSSAVLRASARAFGRPEDLLELAGMSAEASLATGVSATGAFDDALAGLRGGVVVTDNTKRELLRADPVLRDCSVVVWIPGGTHPRAPGLLARFRAAASEAARAVELALSGDYWGAMDRNTELVEHLMRYEYEGIRDRLRAAGALASGVAGFGPALAAVVPRPQTAAALAELPSDTGRRLAVEFLLPGEELPGEP